MKDAYILITMDCNNDCLFCSIPKKELYLSYEEITKKIDSYSDQGFNQITITGGEPTLHEKIFDIISYIKNKNMAARLVTNGTKLTFDFIDELIARKLDYLTVSVHTLNVKDSVFISQNKDYDLLEILDKIKYAVNSNLKVYFNITVNNLNYKILPKMVNFISEQLPQIHMINFNYIDLWGNTLKEKNSKLLSLQYFIAEKYLFEAFSILKKSNIEFRAERIPLCYLVGFEKYSSDYNRFLSLEEPKTDFLERNAIEITPKDYLKSVSCKFCYYSNFCYGVSQHYVKKYGFEEFYPIFHKLN